MAPDIRRLPGLACVKKLLIVQPGEKLASLESVHGDFADWVGAGMGLGEADTRVVYPHRGDEFPDATGFRAVVVTGASAMVTDDEPWMIRGAAWLAETVRAGVPALGICFGHQWLGKALGGEVADNPRGTEVGTVAVMLTPSAADDPLFSGLPATMPLHVSHRQSVTRLPPAAVHLGASVLEPNHAFRYGEHAWGVQFHPEFSAAVLRGYLDYHAARLAARGLDPAILRQSIVETGHGRQILERFAGLAGLNSV